MRKEFHNSFIDGTTAIDIYRRDLEPDYEIDMSRERYAITYFENEYTNNIFYRVKRFAIRCSLLGRPLCAIRLEDISGQPFNRMSKGQAFGVGTLFTIAAFATVFFGV